MAAECAGWSGMPREVSPDDITFNLRVMAVAMAVAMARQ